jgi:hypothetical protein
MQLRENTWRLKLTYMKLRYCLEGRSVNWTLAHSHIPVQFVVKEFEATPLYTHRVINGFTTDMVALEKTWWQLYKSFFVRDELS